MRLVRNYSLGRRVAVGTLCAVAAAGVTAGVALSAGSTGVPVDRPAPADRPAPDALAQGASPAIAAELPVLGRPTTSADKLPAGIEGKVAHWLQEEQVGANGALARKVSTARLGMLYFIPSCRGFCLVSADGPPNICATAAELENGQAQEATLCSPAVPNTEIEIAGVLPQGVTDPVAVLSDGSAVPLALEGDTYLADFPRRGPLPTEIGWTTADGNAKAAPTQVPTSAATEDCAAPPSP
jgi:hypothetical protein